MNGWRAFAVSLAPMAASVVALIWVGAWSGRRKRRQQMTPLDPADDEDALRADVSVAEMVEDHPDPAGEVRLYPLVEGDPGPEDVDGW